MKIAHAPALGRVVETLRSYRFSTADEDELQQAIADVLERAGLDPEREHRLGARDRIDLLVERVGIEVKVAGAARAVERQLARYAESDEIDALILVTSRARHITVPTSLNGKPVVVVSLVGGAVL